MLGTLRSISNQRRAALASFFLASSLVSAVSLYANESNSLITIAEEQIATGEFEEAVSALDSYLTTQRAILGNYDESLIQPYILLGDAHLGNRSPDEAVESYDRAWRVLRSNQGLGTDSQIELLYRLSDAHVAQKNYELANEAQERACEIIIQQYGMNDVRALPGLIKLIEWYESNRRFRAAKILYLNVMQLTRRVMASDDPRRVDVARAFTKAMRNTVFPPLKGEGQFRGFSINIPGYEEPPFGKPIPSSYGLGVRALKDVVELVNVREVYGEDDRIIAKMQLADWHQLFGRETIAIGQYRKVWEDLENRLELRASIFEEPKLLYIRLPEHKLESSQRSKGVVKLRLTVSSRGEVTGRISEEISPKDRSVEHYIRVAAREARFRPAFRDGRPVTTKNFLLTHEYPIHNINSRN